MNDKQLNALAAKRERFLQRIVAELVTNDPTYNRGLPRGLGSGKNLPNIQKHECMDLILDHLRTLVHAEIDRIDNIE